jgi:tetratricopeptide (TPR) repeat protein
MPKLLKIYVSGTKDDMHREREGLARALHSLRLVGAQLDDQYSDERSPRAATMSLVYECDIFIGLYNRTYYGQTDADTGVSFSEQEYLEAQTLDKQRLVYVKRLASGDRASREQTEFVERVLGAGDDHLRATEFVDSAQLEDLAADALMLLLPERFTLRVSRPIYQVPRVLETFVGRESQIENLVNAIAPGRTVLIHGVGDVGGMGKSELAVYAATRLRDQFPDGVLWANVQTARPGDLLVTWGRAFGGFTALGRGDLRFEYRSLSAEERRIAEITFRAEETRRVLAGKRVLAVLDGVTDDQDEAKISPLLRALSDCAVIVTSRTRRLQLPKPMALIELERMTEAEALALFTRIAGARRLENQPAQVAEISRLVDYVPLALDLMATLLRERSSLDPKGLLELVRSERQSLENAQFGYLAMRGLKSALEVSTLFLSGDDKDFLLALGAFAGDDFDVEAAAAVAEVTPSVAVRSLEQLARYSLVRCRRRPERYNLHSVLRTFARDKMPDQSAELRMAKYYSALAKEKGRDLLSADSHSAHSILTTELSNVFAGHHFARKRNDRIGWELSRDYILGAMAYYFNLHAMWSDWISWCQIGLDACQKLGDAASTISIVSSLGAVHQRKGDWLQAVEFYRHALELMEKLNNAAGLAEIYMNLGVAQIQMEAWSEALVSLTKSMQLRQRLGDVHGMAKTRANLGMLYARHGEKVKARAFWMQALEIFDSLGSRNEADIVRRWLKGLPREK